MPGDTEMRGHTAFVGVGGNLGDRQAACRAGLAAIEEGGYGRLTAVSRFYRTAPQDYLDQDWFVNAAARIATDLSPERLLDGFKTIERTMGRTGGGPRFGPRVIDLDLLFYDDLVEAQGPPILPHPRLHKRRFVLQPLCDIEPDYRHPVLGLSLASLLARPEVAGQSVVVVV